MSIDVDALALAINRDLNSSPATYTESPHRGSDRLTAKPESETQQFLQNNECAKPFLEQVLHHCGASTKLHPWQLASCALTLAKKTSTQAAAQYIASVFESTDSAVNDIALISGIHVSKSHQITDNVWLAPISEAPSEQIKSAVREYSDFMKNYMVGRAVSPFFDFGLDTPRAVLWRRRLMPFGFSAETSSVERDGHGFLFALSHLLTLVGPCSPSVRQCATELDESVPLKYYLSQTTYNFGEDTKTNSITEIHDEDIEYYRTIVEKFFRIDQETIESLSTPIARLNLALKHADEVEKAIDLGIALEALFLSDSSKDSPIALPFRLRGAWLLGENSEHREILFKKFQELYDLRSAAVHKGSLGKPKGGKSHSDLLSEGVNLCVSAILKIIDSGTRPTSATWTKLILGG